MTIHTTIHTDAFGALQLIAGDDGLQALSLLGQKHFVTPPQDSVEDSDAALFEVVREQLEAYGAGERRAFDVPLAPIGSSSRLALWRELSKIPYGETTTYGALAARLGSPGMAQAVGQGVGRNPLCIIVPCHRVIGANGSLTGYAGGLERKRQLLELEGALQPTLHG